jgi:hypothetical protein
LLAERLEGLRSRRPVRDRACGENGGDRVGTARVGGETLPPERQREVTVRLARLLARLVEVERDE